jgi:hemerythrin-like domain-containing protein
MADVNLDEAFKRAVASFYNNADYFKNTDKTSDTKVKYTQSFFDDQEKHIRKINKKAMPKAKELLDEVEPEISAQEGDNGNSK